MKGSISIYKSGDRRPNCVAIYISVDAIQILSTKEIVITERHGEIVISRPTLDTKKTFKICGNGHQTCFAPQDVNSILGKYYIEGDETTDEFILIRE